jgi:hypothetical protein
MIDVAIRNICKSFVYKDFLVVKHVASAQPAPDRWPMLTGSSPRILDNLTTAVLTFDADLCLTSINPGRRDAVRDQRQEGGGT